jgi:hypothetical protein
MKKHGGGTMRDRMARPDSSGLVREGDDAPRSLRDAAVRERRKAMLGLPHIAPLTAYAARLRERGLGEVPEIDPLDGGVDAHVLFLFEKPGPMIAAGGQRVGSGFISRNNDDATAEATFRFMEQAKLPRRLTVTWNAIPWWNGTVNLTTQELREGVTSLRELMSLLSKLRAVVMVGQKAAVARPYLEQSGLALFMSDHPSPRVRARWPERWKRIPSEWAKVHRVLDDSQANCTT